jgi:hypothetical protein
MIQLKSIERSYKTGVGQTWVLRFKDHQSDQSSRPRSRQTVYGMRLTIAEDVI